MDIVTTHIDYGLLLDISEYVPDPIEDETERALRLLQLNEEYDIIPSVSNIEGWPKIPLQERRKSRQPRQ